MERLWLIRTVRKSITSHQIFTAVVQALLQTQKLCRLQKIPVLDSTNKSIEEIATNIMQDRGLTPTLY